MRNILLVARTEVLEHRRQKLMLFVLALNYLIWGALFLVFVWVLDTASRTPEMLAVLQQQAAELGIRDGESALSALTRIGNSTFGALFFTTLPLFVAIMSGYSVLHDREKGALPFLMLAPLSRYQLLLGKLLGALAIPTLLHLVFVGGATLVASSFEVMEPFAAQYGGSPAWWIAYLIGAPASGILIGSLGTVISALSRDVRTSMQFISFFVGFLSLAFGFVLFDGITSGVGVQLAFVAGSLVGGLAVLGVGSRIISRDIGS